MKSLATILMAITVLLSSINSFAQIKNVQTENIHIYGNCGMCKSTIEEAGRIKNIAQVDWNKDSKMATLRYDEKKTNPDEILKRIALAGYDSEKFLAPDDVYAQLPACCQYEREGKPDAPATDNSQMMDNGHENHTGMATAHTTKQSQSTLKPVFENYFSLKDALVNTDGASASVNALALSKAIQAVDMSKLSTAEHTLWMKLMKALSLDATHISRTKDASQQRKHFSSLSEDTYALMNVSKLDTAVYYQHCPMYNDGQGANWLSKEEAIKNPYYGSQMLTCGNTVETLK